MSRPIDDYFLRQPEPHKSCLIALREYLLHQVSPHITEAWKYGMPFFCFKGQMFCYLWRHQKHNQPYIGFVNGQRLSHPDLLHEKRARMAILLIDPTQDLPLPKIQTILSQALTLHPNP